MKQDVTPVTVQILDKDYRISCEPGEKASLLESVKFLDCKMREIRSTGKVIGTDRIAVMAALNLAHELLGQQTQKESSCQSVGKRIKALQNKIEIALNSTNQLEL